MSGPPPSATLSLWHAPQLKEIERVSKKCPPDHPRLRVARQLYNGRSLAMAFAPKAVNNLVVVRPPGELGFPEDLRRYVRHCVASNCCAEFAERLRTMSEPELWATDWAKEPRIVRRVPAAPRSHAAPGSPAPSPRPPLAATGCTQQLSSASLRVLNDCGVVYTLTRRPATSVGCHRRRARRSRTASRYRVFRLGTGC